MAILIRILFILLLCTPLLAQEVQEYPVKDFSGGFVNGLSNAIMQDNMSLVLVNYDVVDGSITRRKGMSLHYPDDNSGQTIEGLFRYQNQLNKKLLTARELTSTPYYSDETMRDYINLLTHCDDADVSCTTVAYAGLFQQESDYAAPYSNGFTNLNGRTLIANDRSELMVYDGNKAFPARPRGPGQAKVMAVDSGGNVSGIVRYKYSYTAEFIPDTIHVITDLSPPTWPIEVADGMVVIYDMGWMTDTLRQDSITIYREMNLSGKFERLVSFFIEGDTLFKYWDTTAATTPGDTFNYRWGPIGIPPQWDSIGGCFDTFPPPPGGVVAIADTALAGGMGIATLLIDTSRCRTVVYCVLFVDSSGRSGYLGPPTHISYSYAFSDSTVAVNRPYKVTLDSIPIPKDSGIVEKHLIRMYPRNNVLNPGGNEADDVYSYIFYDIATLAIDSTTYVDRAAPGTGTVYYNARDENDDFISDPTPWDASTDDSLVGFQPSAVTIFNNRCYGIGGPHDRNFLYFSDFGKLTNWPIDKYINIAGEAGDWLTGLYSFEDRLLLFKHNSVQQFVGATFYQYSIEPIIMNVGLTARQSLAGGKNSVFFAHQTGVYRISRFGGFSTYPISAVIQKTVDSVGDKLQRSRGRVVGEEYWWSVAIDSSDVEKTYIYSEFPAPHWKSYSFGIKDAIPYDYDTTRVDYSADRFILIRDNDSLYRWNYAADTLDDTVAFFATYQSKYFFEGGDREKVVYVDLFGTGSVDSLRLIFYRNYGEGTMGTPFDTVVFSPDFTDHTRDRVIVNAICENFSLRVEDFGQGDYILQGYTIGYIPWDRGKL